MNYKNNPKAKRYYWLKLKNDFFEQKEIKLLRRIAGGDTYTIIYLKMMLKSLKNDGKLFYEFFGDNFDEEIALDIDENPEDVAMTIRYLESKGLIELIEGDEYFLNKVPEMLGSEAYSTERSRRHREKKKLHSDNEMLQSNANAFQTNRHETDCNEEIDIELEKEIEKEIEKSNSSKEESLKSIFTFWEQNGFGTMSPLIIEHFTKWIEDFKEIGATTTAAIELIVHSLVICVERGKRNYGYAKAILTDWEQHRYLTVDQVKAEDKKNSSSNNKRQWPDYSIGNKLENTGSSEYDNLGW